jgi:hypothetical protein
MRLLGFGLALVLAGCATSTPYAPADNGGDGYSSVQIEDDRFRVTFEGNASTSRETVESYLLYRAAEITKANGGDYFLVVSRDTERTDEYRTTGFGDPFYRDPFFYPYAGFYYGRGFGTMSSTTRELPEYSAQAEIIVREGETPDDNPHAFDADEIINYLGPRIRRPGEEAGSQRGGRPQPPPLPEDNGGDDNGQAGY